MVMVVLTTMIDVPLPQGAHESINLVVNLTLMAMELLMVPTVVQAHLEALQLTVPVVSWTVIVTAL
jgi:hypothetical protein